MSRLYGNGSNGDLFKRIAQATFGWLFFACHYFYRKDIYKSGANNKKFLTFLCLGLKLSQTIHNSVLRPVLI
jgi:hypothetical protein